MKKVVKNTLSVAMAVALGVNTFPMAEVSTHASAAAKKASVKTTEKGRSLKSVKGLTNDVTKRQKKEKANYKEGQAIVMYRASQENAKKFAKASAFGSDIKVVKSCEFSEENGKGKASTQAFGKSKPSYTVALVKSDKLDTKDLIDALKSNSEVVYAQPNYVRKADAIGNLTGYQWALKNNTNEGIDTGISKIDKSKYKEGEKVIAIVDTGVDYTHPDLKDVMWNNPYQDQLKGAHGYDAVNGDADPMDDYGHGTHCAGIIAANGKDNSGVTGIADGADVKIMALKFLDSEGYGDTYDAITAYNYIYKAQTLGVNVVAVNNSWGGYMDYDFADDVLKEVMNMVGEKGAISCCAASNDATDNDKYNDVSPACLDSDYIISVAASDSKGNLAGFSNYGATTVDLAAPGADILSSVSYDCFNPSIYENKDELCSDFKDFSTGLKEIPVKDIKDYDLSKDKECVYAVDADGEGKVTVDVTDDNFIASKGGALRIHVKDAEPGEVYNVYLPYDRKESETGRYESFMTKFYGPEFDAERFWEDDDYWPSSVYFIDCSVASDGAIKQETGLGADFDGDVDYWNSVSEQFDKKVTAKEAGRGVFAVSIEVLDTDGEYTVVLDDLGYSKPNVKPEQFGKYAFYNGTSMATPYVAGAVAVAKALYPEDATLELKERIINSSKETKGLQGKVATNGTLDVSNFENPSPAVTKVSMNDEGVITLSGAFIKDDVEVTVNGQKVELLSKSNKKVTFKGEMNTSLHITLKCSSGTVEKKAFFCSGEEVEHIGVTDNMGEYDKVFTDGDVLYSMDSDGVFTVYDIENENCYTDPAIFGYEEASLPYLNTRSMGTEFDLVDLFGEDKKTVVVYDISAATPTVYGKDIYTVVTLDLGYSKESVLARFDMVDNKWKKVVDTPKCFYNTYGSTLVTNKNEILFMGGYDTNTQKTIKDVYAYDLATQTWNKKADLPEGKFNAKAVAVDGKVIVALGGTGDDKTTGSGKTFVLDGATWTTGATLEGVVDTATEEVSVTYSAELQKSEELDINASRQLAVRTLKYYNAVAGAQDTGVMFTGLMVEKVGNTFSYDLATNTYKAEPCKFATLNENNAIAGATIGENLYIISGKEYSYDDDDYYYYDSMKVGADKQEITDQSIGYEGVDKEYIELLSAIPVKNTTVLVEQEEFYEEGYFLGLGKYKTGDTANIAIVPCSSEYFTKELIIDGKVQPSTCASIVIGNKPVMVSGTFGKYVTAIYLDTDEVLHAGGSVALNKNVYVYPEDADDTSLIWVSSDETIATVNSKGKVTAKKDAAGKRVTITALAADRGTVEASYTFEVAKAVKTVAVTKITLKASKKTVKAGKSITIKATVSPAKATNKKLTWSVSNKKYATIKSVSGGAKLTAKKAGKGHMVTVTAKSKSNSKVKKSIKIKIK